MKVLVIDDEKSIRQSTSMAVQAEGHDSSVAECRAAALQKLEEDRYDLVFVDLRLGHENGLEVLAEIDGRFPGLPVVVFTAYATVETAVSAMRYGAFDYLEKPFTPEQLRRVVGRVEQTQRLERRITELEQEMASRTPESDYDTEDAGIRQLLDTLFRAGGTAAAILLLGESGTGKSVLAREIHQRSPLQSRPFVTVHCSGLQQANLESEIFGHAHGAADQATREGWGKVAAAHGGTLCLEEIGNLPLDVQDRLLRLLRDKQYERMGETRTRTADTRIIATSQKDLADEVRAGRFREDLYHRLSVIAAVLPPLRNPPVDIPRMARRFTAFFSGQLGRPAKGITPEAMHALQRYPWPGNVRELRNVIERTVILTPGPKIGLEDLPENVRTSLPAEVRPGAMITIEELERQHIAKVLETTESMEAAARMLGIDPATLYRKRKRMQIG